MKSSTVLSPAALLLLAFCGTVAWGDSAETLPASPPADVSAALNMLHDRGATLQDFTATVRKEDTTRTGDRELHKGTAGYQKVGDVIKIGLHFDSVSAEDVPTRKLDEDAVVDGPRFIHRDGIAKTYDIKELVPPGKNFNPLKLGVGPFPLPIGQDPAEMWREFAVTKEPVDPKMVPPGYKADELIHLKLVPRKANKYGFKSAELYVDPTLQIPVKISTLAADDARSTLTLTDVKTNQGPPKVLNVPLPPADSGWVVREDPYQPDPGDKPAQ